MSLNRSWTEKAAGFQRDINVATVQLKSLESSDESLWESIRTGLFAFVQGRGLTLALALVVALIVYSGCDLITNALSRRLTGQDKKALRTRQRIVHFGSRALKGVIVATAIITVFYVRGDILLLALSFLLAGAIFISARHVIPRFLDELKLLLNLGSVREDERVMYQGLPWKVAQLNMHSLLSNPEITGVLRLPMHEMLNLTSRPSGGEPWFPASKGDYILLEDGRMLRVIKLTPEHVLLENLAEVSTMIPTAEFYTMAFENLSRSPAYFVSTEFGIGYSHQGDSVVGIPDTPWAGKPR